MVRLHLTIGFVKAVKPVLSGVGCEAWLKWQAAKLKTSRLSQEDKIRVRIVFNQLNKFAFDCPVVAMAGRTALGG